MLAPRGYPSIVLNGLDEFASFACLEEQLSCLSFIACLKHFKMYKFPWPPPFRIGIKTVVGIMLDDSFLKIIRMTFVEQTSWILKYVCEKHSGLL